MKICFTADEPNGLDSVISYHFGHCPYYVIVEVEGDKVKDVQSIPNPLADRHNPGDLPKFMKEKGIDVIVTGGMGPKAQQFFLDFGIKPVVGAYGKVKDVLEDYLKGKVVYEGTTEVEESHEHKEGSDELERLKKEVLALRKQIAELKSMLKDITKNE